MSRRSSAVRSQLFVDFSEEGLNRLQLQYRRADGAKRTHTEKTQGLILRDEREIHRLQDEREELLRSLRVSQSFFNHWIDASVVQDLTAMLACGDRTDEVLEAEKGKMASLKDQILKCERMLAGQKTGRRTIHCSRNLIKNTCLIKNKLHRGRKGLNMMMTKNRELREELEILQMEKKQFLNVQSCLEKELHAICKDIRKLVTKHTEAFNASVKSQERQRMLMDQNAEHVAQYIKEKSNMEQEISFDSNFEVFFDLKSIARNNQDTDHRKEKHKQCVESKESRLEDFEDAIKKIFTATEESDLDKLVRNFIQMEEQNYTLLKFVNYQHNEAETNRRQISQICNEREIFVAEEQQQREQHQAVWRKVSIKREAIEQQLAGYQQRVDFTEKLLNQLKEGVESLLQISCDSSVTGDQSASSDGVQDESIVECLRRVDNRVNELLTLQSFLHFQENLNPWDHDSLSTIAGQLLGVTPPAVNLTTAAATPAPAGDPEMMESVLREAKEPASRDDLLTLVNKRIQRKMKTD